MNAILDTHPTLDHTRLCSTRHAFPATCCSPFFNGLQSSLLAIFRTSWKCSYSSKTPCWCRFYSEYMSQKQAQLLISKIRDLRGFATDPISQPAVYVRVSPFILRSMWGPPPRVFSNVNTLGFASFNNYYVLNMPILCQCFLSGIAPTLIGCSRRCRSSASQQQQ